MARSLYICYFGVREPLVQTQVIPYLRELVKGGHDLTLLTFEPDPSPGLGQFGTHGTVGQRDSWQEQVRSELAADGIEWHWLRYHKRPSVPATLFDIANGARHIRALMRRKPFDILHARSHVPMMMAALARKASGDKPKLLFDIRGFMPEEFVDAGLWPAGGSIYRSVKRTEGWLMKQANGYVVLTEKAKEILADETGTKPVEIIPCCVNIDRFRIADESSRAEYRTKLAVGDSLVVTYVGAFGGWYLTKEIADFFSVLRKIVPKSFPLILSQSDPEMIRPMMKAGGFDESDYFIKKVSSDDIPKYLSAADAAISFIKPCYSKQASSPTKNAEYLACGLPIIANAGIGDTDRHITKDGVGVLIEDFSETTYAKAIEELKLLMMDPSTSARCKRTAALRFDLASVGGTRYLSVYKALLED